MRRFDVAWAVVILVLLIFTVTSVRATSPRPSERFATETKIHWNLIFERNGDSKMFSGKEIDELLGAGIGHPELGVSCRLHLERETIKFSASQDRGYSRDEERAQVSCEMASGRLDIGTAICARGRGRKGLGNITGDSKELRISRDGASFLLKIICVLK